MPVSTRPESKQKQYEQKGGEKERLLFQVANDVLDSIQRGLGELEERRLQVLHLLVFERQLLRNCACLQVLPWDCLLSRSWLQDVGNETKRERKKERITRDGNELLVLLWGKH